MIDRDILREILSEKAIEKQFAEDLAQKNVEIANNDSEYANFEKQKRQLIFDIGLNKFEKKDTAELEKQLDKTIKNQEKVLKKIGLKKESLQPIYSCGYCNDTGYYNGKICKCVSQKYYDKLMKNSNIDFEDVKTLDEYQTDCFEDENEIKSIVSKLKQFVDCFEESKIKNIVLCGKTGVGKTYLSKSVAKTLIEKGYPCLFISAYSLNNEFLMIYTSKNENKLLELQRLISPELLIIDDLGSEPKLNNMTIEYLLMLISERINQGKKTIITSNFAPNYILDRYEERIFSRLFDKSNSMAFNLTGKDLRLKK